MDVSNIIINGNNKDEKNAIDIPVQINYGIKYVNLWENKSYNNVFYKILSYEFILVF